MMNTSLKHIHRAFLVCILTAAPLFFVSCIDSDAEISLNSDGSGTLSLAYTVSPLVMNIGRLGEDDTFMPLPVSEDDFLRSANGIAGLELRNYSARADNEGFHVEAELRFQTAGALSGFLATGENTVSVSTEEGDAGFRYLVYEAPEQEIQAESAQLVRDFFADSTLVFTLNSPEQIQTVSVGSIEDNGRTAVLELNTAEIVLAGEDVLWEVGW